MVEIKIGCVAIAVGADQDGIGMTLALSNISIDCSDAASLGNLWASVFRRNLDEGASEDFKESSARRPRS